jgi:hypothetical protein
MVSTKLLSVALPDHFGFGLRMFSGTWAATSPEGLMPSTLNAKFGMWDDHVGHIDGSCVEDS